MEPVKHFDVLSMGIDILVSSASTNNSFTISAYDCPPSVGPPPHFHDKEDEIFKVVQGSFEIFDGKEWKDIPKGDYVHALRHKVHTFRNSGTTMGGCCVSQRRVASMNTWKPFPRSACRATCRCSLRPRTVLASRSARLNLCRAQPTSQTPAIAPQLRTGEAP